MGGTGGGGGGGVTQRYVALHGVGEGGGGGGGVLVLRNACIYFTR